MFSSAASNYRVTELSRYRIIALPNYRVTELSRYRIIALPNYRVTANLIIQNNNFYPSVLRPAFLAGVVSHGFGAASSFVTDAARGNASL